MGCCLSVIGKKSLEGPSGNESIALLLFPPCQIDYYVYFVSTMETTFPSNLVQCCPVLTLLPASSPTPLQAATLALLPAPPEHGEGV